MEYSHSTQTHSPRRCCFFLLLAFSLLLLHTYFFSLPAFELFVSRLARDANPAGEGPGVTSEPDGMLPRFHLHHIEPGEVLGDLSDVGRSRRNEDGPVFILVISRCPVPRLPFCRVSVVG